MKHPIYDVDRVCGQINLNCDSRNTKHPICGIDAVSGQINLNCDFKKRWVNILTVIFIQSMATLT